MTALGALPWLSDPGKGESDPGIYESFPIGARIRENVRVDERARRSRCERWRNQRTPLAAHPTKPSPARQNRPD